MKKAIILILIIIPLTSCINKEVDGVWVSYKSHDIDKGYSSDGVGMVVNFDNQTMGNIQNDSIVPVEIDFKQAKLKLQSKKDTLNIGFSIYKKDSIEFNFEDGNKLIFKPLNLIHKQSISKIQIKDFLINNKFRKTHNKIDVEFSSNFFYHDKLFEKPHKKNALINNSWNDEGYWTLKEIDQNFFLTFTLSQIANQNIYQIIKVDKCKMELLLLQKDDFIYPKITELKTCL